MPARTRPGRRSSHAPRRACALLVLGVLALGLATGPAASQQEEACRPPDLLVSKGPALWSPGSSFPFQFAVENANVAPVESATARLDATAPAGWSVSLSQTSILMRPEDTTIVAVTVTAPQRGTGVASGDLVLGVQFTCHREGGFDTRASASARIPVELAAAQIPWFVLAGGLVLVGGVSGSVWAYRWRQGPVGVESDLPERPVAPGRSVQFHVRVVNRRRTPDVVHLSITGEPDGWGSHVAVTELTLEGREERELWIALRAPPEARPGDEVEVTVHGASARFGKDPAAVTVRARVRREE